MLQSIWIFSTKMNVITANITPNSAPHKNEIVRMAIENHALKLSPQEQLVAALGFFTLKPPSCNAST